MNVHPNRMRRMVAMQIAMGAPVVLDQLDPVERERMVRLVAQAKKRIIREGIGLSQPQKRWRAKKEADALAIAEAVAARKRRAARKVERQARRASRR